MWFNLVIVTIVTINFKSDCTNDLANVLQKLNSDILWQMPVTLTYFTVLGI